MKKTRAIARFSEIGYGAAFAAMFSRGLGLRGTSLFEVVGRGSDVHTGRLLTTGACAPSMLGRSAWGLLLAALATSSLVFATSTSALADKSYSTASEWTLEWYWEPVWGPWRGEVNLTIPEDSGPVSGQGTWQSTTAVTGGSCSYTGSLLIAGSVENGALTFTPDYVVDTMVCNGQSLPPPADPGLDESPVSIPVEDGAQHKIFGQGAEWVWRLKGSEEQTWRVRLTGQETDDLGGKTIHLKKPDGWKSVTVDYGVRFDFALVAEFTIRKKKGRWTYKEGHVTQASVKASSNFDPTVYSIKGVNCRHCAEAAKLVGQSVSGTLDGQVLSLSWPDFKPSVVVENRIRLEFESKQGEGRGYSENLFSPEQFIDQASEHRLPLQDKSDKEFTMHFKSTKDQFRTDPRPTPTLFYRYFLERMR